MGWWRKFLRNFYRGAIPNLERCERDLPPLHIRAYQNSDYERCSELYALNEAGRFPEGLIADFQQALQKRNALYLVAEVEGRVVAMGGISAQDFTDHLRFATISYGLVDPAFHGKGYGTALLLFRLSLLSLDRSLWPVTMSSAGNGTENFYKAFGFRFVQTFLFDAKRQITLDSYVMQVPRTDILLFRDKVLKSGITVTGEDAFDIPVEDKKEAYAEALLKQTGWR